MAVGLGMNVSAVDPFASPEIASAASVNLHLSLASLLPTCDFLTIHTPLIASTKGMISHSELAAMKPGSRILNVARGGMIDETALLEALESGHIAGAGLDVFTSEPPQPDSPAAKAIAHPKVVATPHLGASTVEAQENVSLDVCSQVLSILSGDLPRSAVNAPLILPEEYKKLQPFVRLVEKMGALYTQHYAARGPPGGSQQAFDLVYEGEIAGISNTKPLFAALVKGLTKAISSNTNVNIVNASLIAKERGLIISEQHSRDPITHTYSSLVTLRARPSRSASQERLTSPTFQQHLSGQRLQEQVIQGYCSDAQIFISRLDRFTTGFVPEGTLLICHNYDSPGKIGSVGGVLGRAGVNISYMNVAPVSEIEDQERAGEGVEKAAEKEALMILGVDRELSKEVMETLKAEKGILDLSVVTL